MRQNKQEAVQPETEPKEKEPEKEKTEPTEYTEQPNKISLVFGDLAVNIESVDTDTEGICGAALDILEKMILTRYSATPQGSEQETEQEKETNQPGDGNPDLDSQKEYEKLMENI